MTEENLLAYRDARVDYAIARDALREFYPSYYAAGVSRLTGLPRGAPSYSPDRTSQLVDAHQRYVDAWREAYDRMKRSYAVLSFVAGLVSGEKEKQFIYYRYVKGMKIAEISRRLHRSVSSLKRDRRAIIELIKDIPVPVLN